MPFVRTIALMPAEFWLLWKMAGPHECKAIPRIR